MALPAVAHCFMQQVGIWDWASRLCWLLQHCFARMFHKVQRSAGTRVSTAFVWLVSVVWQKARWLWLIRHAGISAFQPRVKDGAAQKITVALLIPQSVGFVWSDGCKWNVGLSRLIWSIWVSFPIAQLEQQFTAGRFPVSIIHLC